LWIKERVMFSTSLGEPVAKSSRCGYRDPVLDSDTAHRNERSIAKQAYKIGLKKNG
jgi:hypothetical protein